MKKVGCSTSTDTGQVHYLLTVILQHATEVRSANEVALVQTVYGTDLCALTAAVTERIVDNGEVINNLDSSGRAGLLTLHTCDTTVGAVFTSNRALVVARALYDDPRDVVYKTDNGFGAFAYADAATDTFARFNFCYAVFN